MKKYSGYEYVSGDFENQEEILYKSLGSVTYGSDFAWGWDERSKNNALLINSAERGELALVKFALERGAEINSYHGRALIDSSKNGYMEIIQYLFDNGATNQVHAVNKAIVNNKLDVLKYLISRTPIFANSLYIKSDTITRAVKRGRLAILKYLYEDLKISITIGVLNYAKKNKTKKSSKYLTYL